MVLVLNVVGSVLFIVCCSLVEVRSLLVGVCCFLNCRVWVVVCLLLVVVRSVLALVCYSLCIACVVVVVLFVLFGVV